MRLVFNTESPSPDILGEYHRTVEDTIEYLNTDGEICVAPVDCVAVIDVDVSHLPNA